MTEADRFLERLSAIKRVLSGQQRDANLDVKQCEKALLNTFGLYQASWYDPNLGDTLDSYPDYLRILTTSRRPGSTKTAQSGSVPSHSGPVKTFSHSLSRCRARLRPSRSRIVPINDILAGLEFGARKGRLRLKVDDLNTETVRQFRSDCGRLPPWRPSR